MKWFIYGTTLALIVLKLTGHIEWSWFHVCMPILFLWLFQLIAIGLYIYIEYKKRKLDRDINNWINSKGTEVKKSKFQQRMDAYWEKARTR